MKLQYTRTQKILEAAALLLLGLLFGCVAGCHSDSALFVSRPVWYFLMHNMD